jgi:hypothetical protein
MGFVFGQAYAIRGPAPSVLYLEEDLSIRKNMGTKFFVGR